MADLFEAFPYLGDDRIIIRKMDISDASALEEITENDNVYKYIPLFLYKKSRQFLETAIKNMGGRDFDKKKMIIAGIYLLEAPDVLVGLAEMFDYKKRQNVITVGYRLNEKYWNRGIATAAVKLMREYLTDEIGVKTLRAFVMPENVFSGRALLKNGFVKENFTATESNWGGRETVTLDVYTYEK